MPKDIEPSLEDDVRTIKLHLVGGLDPSTGHRMPGLAESMNEKFVEIQAQLNHEKERTTNLERLGKWTVGILTSFLTLAGGAWITHK